MNDIVLDPSVTLSWLLPDEAGDKTLEVIGQKQENFTQANTVNFSVSSAQTLDHPTSSQSHLRQLRSSV